MRRTEATTRADASPVAASKKTATLAFSVRLRSLLSARGIVVVTTRESDVTLDPDQRAEIANHMHAQACLSLHASESGAGVHLFTSSLHAVAARALPGVENGAVRMDYQKSRPRRRSQLGPAARRASMSR